MHNKNKRKKTELKLPLTIAIEKGCSSWFFQALTIDGVLEFFECEVYEPIMLFISTL